MYAPSPVYRSEEHTLPIQLKISIGDLQSPCLLLVDVLSGRSLPGCSAICRVSLSHNGDFLPKNGSRLVLTRLLSFVRIGTTLCIWFYRVVLFVLDLLAYISRGMVLSHIGGLHGLIGAEGMLQVLLGVVCCLSMI
jgi:hypothetical protein